MQWHRRKNMTSDEIIKLIEDNGLTLHGDIEHFAELVAQHEREKFCAVLRQLHDSYSLASDPSQMKARTE
jgi:hypothetical protein